MLDHLTHYLVEKKANNITEIYMDSVAGASNGGIEGWVSCLASLVSCVDKDKICYKIVLHHPQTKLQLGMIPIH